MARYVCDFESIRNAIEKLDKKITTMTDDLNKYRQDITDELSGWEGLSKSTFIEKNNNMMDSVQKSIERLEKISIYLKKVVSKIEGIESSLASIKI